MSFFRSKTLEAARVIGARREFSNSEIIAIRRMAARGANLREIMAAFPLSITMESFRRKLLRLGLHVRRATSDIRCGDNVTVGNHGRFHDRADARPYRPGRS